MLKLWHTRGLADVNDLSAPAQIAYSRRVENEFLTMLYAIDTPLSGNSLAKAPLSLYVCMYMLQPKMYFFTC